MKLIRIVGSTELKNTQSNIGNMHFQFRTAF